jgi:CcmD family protein
MGKGKLTAVTNRLRTFWLLILGFISIIPLRAQEIEMADTFRAEGKIYVVVAVMLVIFSGLIVYLIYVDRKVSKLEKEMASDHKKEKS